MSASSLRDFTERVRGARHADSALVVLDDEEFARGLAELERASAREMAPAPVVDRLTVLLLR